MLALQGAFREHREVLDALGVDAVEVRTPEQLGALDALILPGGESTTMSKLLDTSGAARAARRALLADGLPVLGTCAGLILLAREVVDGRARPAVVRRDRRRRPAQRATAASATRSRPRWTSTGSPAARSRACSSARRAIERVGAGVEVLARTTGDPVLARSGHVWVASFHPELSGDLRLHELFLSNIA